MRGEQLANLADGLNDGGGIVALPPIATANVENGAWADRHRPRHSIFGPGRITDAIMTATRNLSLWATRRKDLTLVAGIC